MVKPLMVNAFNPANAERLDAPLRALLARRQRVLGPSYKLFYEEPVHLVRAEGVYMYDADGNRYLDCVGSWGPLPDGKNPEFLDQANPRRGLPSATPCAARLLRKPQPASTCPPSTHTSPPSRYAFAGRSRSSDSRPLRRSREQGVSNRDG